ncbi:MAG: hypothetical protein M1826_004848 [Phylliscum demangeonii]|nr:MAG: hypothetical protein M1826_004848 [Phylliscum demangeonii]
MKFVHCLIPVGAFIVGSDSLYIPPGQLRHVSRELARPNTPSMLADIASKRTTWPSQIVKPRFPKHAVLAKRTTDEASANRQEDVDRGMDARNAPIVYTPEEMAGFREQRNTAKRALYHLQNRLQKAKDAGLDVSEDDVHELSKLKAAFSQQSNVIQKARRGKPIGRVLKLDVASLEQDPKIQEAAKLGVYTARQLAEYKRSSNDATNRLRARKAELAKATKVRSITEAEEKELADLTRVSSVKQMMWERARKGRLVDQGVSRRKMSMDDLLGSDTLHEIAQSSGYAMEELAEAKRRWLDSRNAVAAFKTELEEVEKVRMVTPEENEQLQALVHALSRQETLFKRMIRGKPANKPAPRKKKLHETAQSSGFTKEEMARQQEPASPAGQADPASKEDTSAPPPRQPFQMSGPPHLLAPVLSSASHFYQGLSRQWRAMPWTRYLTTPRVKMAKPAELLRAEHAL